MKFIEPNWPAPKGIKAYTTLRSAWGKRLPHHEATRGQINANVSECVSENLTLKTLLQLPADPIWITQEHTNIALPAISENKEKIADATYADHPNRVCIVLTADCLPVLLCNRDGTHVAAIHAGWRGLASGIIESTLKALNQDNTRFLAWLGPAIGPNKFEVGEDVYTAFTEKNSQTTIAFKPHNTGKWLANLYQLATLQLQACGIQQIYGGDFCTFTQEELFFSYRREKGRTGRMASVIWIEQV